MKRYMAFLFSLILLTVGLSATAQATNSRDGFSWISSFGGWVDNDCGTSAMQFRIILYEDGGYSGDKTKICTSQSTFCNVPRGSGDHSKDNCDIGWFNDEASSMDVQYIPSGYVCLYQNINYGGSWNYTVNDQYQLAHNDWFSSVKRCSGA